MGWHRRGRKQRPNGLRTGWCGDSHVCDALWHRTRRPLRYTCIRLAFPLRPCEHTHTASRRGSIMFQTFHMHCSSSFALRIASLLMSALLLCSCASQRFPQDYYAARNSGDRIALGLRLGMTVDEVRKSVSDSELKDSVKEGPLDAVRSEKEILGFYEYAIYPRDVLDDMKIGTQYRWYSYWITAHTSKALYLFFDKTDRLRGWANYPSNTNFERYWHERTTSRLRVRTQEKKGMTRAEVNAMIGPEATTPVVR